MMIRVLIDKKIALPIPNKAYDPIIIQNNKGNKIEF